MFFSLRTKSSLFSSDAGIVVIFSPDYDIDVLFTRVRFRLFLFEEERLTSLSPDDEIDIALIWRSNWRYFSPDNAVFFPR